MMPLYRTWSTVFINYLKDKKEAKKESIEEEGSAGRKPIDRLNVGCATVDPFVEPHGKHHDENLNIVKFKCYQWHHVDPESIKFWDNGTFSCFGVLAAFLFC